MRFDIHTLGLVDVGLGVGPITPMGIKLNDLSNRVRCHLGQMDCGGHMGRPVEWVLVLILALAQSLWLGPALVKISSSDSVVSAMLFRK